LLLQESKELRERQEAIKERVIQSMGAAHARVQQWEDKAFREVEEV